MSPYGPMAAVEGTRVMSVLVYDCSEIFVFFFWWSVWKVVAGALPWPKLVCDQPNLCPLQPPESRIFWRNRRVRQASYHRRVSSRRLIDVVEIARSACPSVVVWLASYSRCFGVLSGVSSKVQVRRRAQRVDPMTTSTPWNFFLSSP